MERYGPASEVSQTDPSPERNSTGPNTDLQESLWQLRLSGAESYPEHPDEADCIYYLRTGFCGYGARCRFNHPLDRAAILGAARLGWGEYPERVGQPVCQYYMRTGTCKFGASCKFHHPRQGRGSVKPVLLNFHGYPLRPGEKECSYYVKTGQCKFGATCNFHHAQPTRSLAPQVSPVSAPVPSHTLYSALQSPYVPSSQPYGVVVARPPLMPGSYIQGPYGPLMLSPGMVPFPGWNPYLAPISPVASPSTQPTGGPGSLYGITQLSPSVPAYTGPYQPISHSADSSSSSQKESKFPERSGQPDCQYYLRTGDCKFGSSCRYHHPSEWSALKSVIVLSPFGLPLRPGAPPCTHYAQRGVCKFGPECRFDHPIGPLTYSPSASSLPDMPVAPYPVQTTIGTLAPSSSSLELQSEVSEVSISNSISDQSPGSSTGIISTEANA